MSKDELSPAISQEARYEPAAVIPVKRDSSIINWLEATNRLIYREQEETKPPLEEDAEISELIDVDDNYDDDDDDVSLDDDD
ncbi:DUF3134 domain-containing protein [Crocosphaera chwakensis]|uniref:DUF3134 domain-containing protein n=1 Tax=Crocosphaera chwakensis CCY0110 TaxID=391612 RepID=A3IMS2_9CHRO|nr:DUF3134 domain-containing protein [Crocosphaera chwakensis]EAZ92175.1 hypothetical protein CY0110_24731 [Crocosphaera chwakensis CCY0110]